MKKWDDFIKEPVSHQHKKNVLDMAKSQMKSQKSFMERYAWLMGVATTALVAIVVTNSLRTPDEAKNLNLMQFSSIFAVDDISDIDGFDDFELIEILDELENWEEG